MIKFAITSCAALVLLCGSAIAQKDDQATLHLIRGVSLQNIGEENAALAEYDTAIAMGLRQYVAYHNRGGLLLVMTRYEEALRDIDSSLKLLPGDPASHGLRARCLLHLRKLPDALKDADIVLAKEPNNAEILGVRGRIKLELNDYAGACADLRRAKELGEEGLDRYVPAACR